VLAAVEPVVALVFDNDSSTGLSIQERLDPGRAGFRDALEHGRLGHGRDEASQAVRQGRPGDDDRLQISVEQKRIGKECAG